MAARAILTPHHTTPPNGPWGEDHSDYLPERRALFPKQLELKGTIYPVPTEPGHGIEVDEEVARGQQPRHWESLHWRRKDGSYTNY